MQIAKLRDQLLHDAVAFHQLVLGLLPIFRDAELDQFNIFAHARRHSVTPSGLSSRMMPSASNAARIRSDSAKFFAFLAALRAAISASMSGPPAAAPVAVPCRNCSGARSRMPIVAASALSWRASTADFVLLISLARSNSTA